MARKPTYIQNVRRSPFPGMPYMGDVFTSRESAESQIRYLRKHWYTFPILYRVNVYLKPKRRARKA